MPDAIIRAAEREWGSAVYGHYGMTEMGLGGGVECQERRGYHLREADMLFEIVNPATGQPVAEGENGEVVFTTLTRKGMPLIRYRTGDIGRFIPGPCPCGTCLKTLERIRYRADGFVAIGEGRHLTVAGLDEALLSIGRVLDYDAVLCHSPSRAALRLRVYAIDGNRGSLIGDVEAALDTIPAIHLARTQRRLEVQIEIWENRAPPPHPVKRTIHEEAECV